jgi:hypothetical protein
MLEVDELKQIFKHYERLFQIKILKNDGPISTSPKRSFYL